jgi:hypothetical protein
MSRRYQRKRFPSPQAQLSLPLDYSQSESDALSRNHAPLKRKRWRRWQDALATSPTIPVRHGIVQASCPLDTNKFRQRQQFLLTPTLSTIINSVQMSQHFLLSPAARSLSLAKVARMSGEEAHDAFRLIRWADTKGEPVCPRCQCNAAYKYETRKLWKCKACSHQ